MTIRQISPDESLQSIWEELVYTEARLLNDPQAQKLAADFSGLLKRWAKVSAGQLAVWRDEIVAQAGVDAADDDLDEQVDEIDHALLHLDRDRGSPRYRRYFSKPRNEIVRMGLETELDRVRAWPPSLAGEPEKELKGLGKQLGKSLAAGDEAVKERRAAAGATADHRVRKIVSFVDEVNGVRQSTYGELIKRGQAKKLPKGWAERFFRRTQRAKANGSAEVPAPAVDVAAPKEG
jgi:hypothetical protein